MAKKGPELLDPRLAKAVEHPIRIEILGILLEGPSSPARIERQLPDVSLNLISHHIKVLKELGCIELMETVSKQGAKEHIYRALEVPIVGDEEWEGLDARGRHVITVAILRLISSDLAISLAAGKVDELPNRHLSRTPLKLDRAGWAEIVDLLEHTLNEVLEVNKRSLKRIETSGEAPKPVTVALMQFPTVEGTGPKL